jgi:hypothetical protein
MAAGWPRRSGSAGSRCGWLAELVATLAGMDVLLHRIGR